MDRLWYKRCEYPNGAYIAGHLSTQTDFGTEARFACCGGVHVPPQDRLQSDNRFRGLKKNESFNAVAPVPP